MKMRKKQAGFTLIEMLLVMVIIGALLVMFITYTQQKTLSARIDRISNQMQQVLNAGLSYYVTNGTWPKVATDLQGTYLPTAPLTTPWGGSISFVPAQTTPPALFYVYTGITQPTASTSGSASSTANVIAGLLPLSYTTANTPDSSGHQPAPGKACDNKTTTCYVVAAVNIPGQNLNNASAVNYAGIYHNGACVPQPQCPVDSGGNTMIPQIMVVPVSVSGVNNQSSPNSVYPISSFTASATTATLLSGSSGPPACPSNTSPTNTACYSDSQGVTLITDTTKKYWRVCLQVITENGVVGWGADTSPVNWGKYATVLAITRCSISGEPNGSSFNVWAP